MIPTTLLALARGRPNFFDDGRLFWRCAVRLMRLFALRVSPCAYLRKTWEFRFELIFKLNTAGWLEKFPKSFNSTWDNTLNTIRSKRKRENHITSAPLGCYEASTLLYSLAVMIWFIISNAGKRPLCRVHACISRRRKKGFQTTRQEGFAGLFNPFTSRQTAYY